MTTATPSYKTTTVGSVVRRALVLTLLAGAVLIVLGALVSGSAAAVAAVIGTVMVCVFFGLGAMVLDVVAKLAPATSLLIALLTYTLKVVLIGLVFVGLQRSGALQDAVHGQWLGGTVIACTLVWLAAQVTFSMRSREPLYDLPSEPEEPSVR